MSRDFSHDQQYPACLDTFSNDVPPVDDLGDIDPRFVFEFRAYDDPQDLYYQDRDYAYKVLSLKVLFLNSAVASFSSRIELMINALFGDPCILRGSGHGNNLILEGAYQQQGGQAQLQRI